MVYKHFVVHPTTATIPAQAVCAAHKQGKFTEMENLIWEKGYKTRQFGADNMEKLAQELQLNMAKFKADMNGECVQIVQNDRRQLAQVGASGTPAFFINGRFLSGARPVEMFKAVIDEEMKKANAAIEKGTPVEKYYEEFVVKKGLKKLDKK